MKQHESLRPNPALNVRLGIRLQLLLALGALLLLAFVPLFFAVASLTRATMIGVRESSARALGRAIAGHVAAASRGASPNDLVPLLDAQLGNEGASAIGIYDAAGTLVTSVGQPLDALPQSIPTGIEAFTKLQTTHGDAVLVVVPSELDGHASQRGAIAVVVDTAPSTVRSAPLVRLVALYTGIVALALLIFAYFAMTRMVVQPVVELCRAADRVATGARKLDVPRSGASELADLGASLALMTERLRHDEEALRLKIDEIQRYAADLKRAQERLIRSERLASVGRLSAGLAHEIGNPIAAILGLLDLLLEGGLSPEETTDFQKRIKKETERIHKILRDLLDFARPASSGPIGNRAGSVADAVTDVLALVQPQKAFRDVEVITELSPEIACVVLSRERLVQVLLNLLLNAADVVPLASGRIWVRASQDDTSVKIEVEDNGPGLAPEIRDRLFEPFTTTKDPGKGTGLGLAVCRGLVEAAGGSIHVEDGDQGGARFVLLIPAEGMKE